MNLETPSLFSEEVEIKTSDSNGLLCRSSSAHLVQSSQKPSESDLTGSKSAIGNSSFTTTLNRKQQKITHNKGSMTQHLDGPTANPGPNNLEKKDDSQPGPSGEQQTNDKQRESEVKPGIINAAKLLCKSEKINANQLQRLVKYVTLTRGITSRNSTGGKTDHSKLANLLTQLTQQLKGKQVESVSQQQQPVNQQVDFKVQQAHSDGHQSDWSGQVQSIDHQVKANGQETHVQHEAPKEVFQSGVTKDLGKTLSTVQSVSHPIVCQTTRSVINTFSNTVTNSSGSTSSSNKNQGSIVTKMLHGIDLQAFTPVDQALSLFEVTPTQQQQRNITPQFSPDSLDTVSESYCPSISAVSVTSATTLPTQIDVGHGLDNSMIEANASVDWEYPGTNLADLLIPDNSGSDTGKDNDDWSTASLVSGDGHLLGMLKPGPTEELPGTSGITYTENNIQNKNQSEAAAFEFYHSPEKVLKLESPTDVQSNASSGFTQFALPCTNSKPSSLKRKRYKKTADALQGSGLMDITVKTAELIQRNRKLQKDIEQLKSQAAEFYQSVLQNPENRGLRDKLTMTK